jgi:hypothetical protein
MGMARAGKLKTDRRQGGAEEEPTLRLTAARWNAWLAKQHRTAAAALLVLTKKGVVPATMSYAEALEVALAWGWIDGHKRPLDDQAWIQRFTPRRAKSAWSKINRAKAEALIAAGKMQPAGFAEVERAKQDGGEQEGAGVLRDDRRDESLCDLVSDASGEAGGDPRGEDRDVRGDARAR